MWSNEVHHVPRALDEHLGLDDAPHRPARSLAGHESSEGRACEARAYQRILDWVCTVGPHVRARPLEDVVERRAQVDREPDDVAAERQARILTVLLSKRVLQHVPSVVDRTDAVA